MTPASSDIANEEPGDNVSVVSVLSLGKSFLGVSLTLGGESGAGGVGAMVATGFGGTATGACALTFGTGDFTGSGSGTGGTGGGGSTSTHVNSICAGATSRSGAGGSLDNHANKKPCSTRLATRAMTLDVEARRFTAFTLTVCCGRYSFSPINSRSCH